MSEKQWFQKPLRMVQSVLREPDIRNYDAQNVVAYLRRVGANCMVVNGGGVIDYFPNKTHLARHNRFLGEQDWLAELIAACHEADIRVIARVDFRGVEPERYESQPDWFAQDKDGNPHILWGFIRRPCYTGEYANGHAEEFVRQFLSRYDVDGTARGPAHEPDAPHGKKLWRKQGLLRGDFRHVSCWERRTNRN